MPIITINMACFVGGNQYQVILKSSGVKNLTTLSSKLWKRKSKRNVRPSSTKPTPATATAKEHIHGDIGRRKIRLTNDFTQAGERYRSLSKVDQDHLVGNIVDSLSHAAMPIQKRMVENLRNADPEFGKRVAKGLKL